MAISEKINLTKSISLLLFYVAMALSIVYFDLFQAIEDSSKNCPSVENVELLIEPITTTNNADYKLKSDQYVPEQILKTTQLDAFQFQLRLFHDNRNLAHQFKEIAKRQFLITQQSHHQIALIISHQKMEEEGNTLLA